MKKEDFQKKRLNSGEKIFKNSKDFVKEAKVSKIEKLIIKRLKKKKKEIKPSGYIKTANKIFSKLSEKLIKKKVFEDLEIDLSKANLQLTLKSYVSIILFTTLLSIFAGISLFLFFLFFNFGIEFPIITRATESISKRFLKVFWILFMVPLGTFFMAYIYPSLEKKSAEFMINEELPFVVIHMSAISGSMIDPSKIFSIIISTKEYPCVGKEFTKLINEINVYGYDLVTALRKGAYNSPSKKLAELFNGLTTTINSGGDLPKFFDKRAETLLFEHKMEKEKASKTAETFMDMYISMVIAAPMILMLLLMMMKVSGLGISLSTSMITLIMVLIVTIVNIFFLSFLQMKKS